MSQKWCLVQTDDRTDDQLGDMAKLMNHNRTMCNGDADCTYIRETEGNANVAPYWRKVHAIKQCLERDECGVCMYLDTDAILNSKEWKGSQSIDAFLESKDMGLSCDWGRDRFNAGVFAVKNTAIGHAIVDKWLDTAPSNAWSRESNGKWKCTSANGSKCRWAGVEYEQGAFIKHIFPEYSEHINEASPHKWNNENYTTCEGSVKHFLGDYGQTDGSGKKHAVRTFLNGKCGTS